MKDNKLEYVIGHKDYNKWKLVDAFLDVTYGAQTFDTNGYKNRVMRQLRDNYDTMHDIHFTIEFKKVPKFDKELLKQFLFEDRWGVEGWNVIKDMYNYDTKNALMRVQYDDSYRIMLHDLKDLVKQLEQYQVSNTLSDKHLKYLAELKEMIVSAEYIAENEIK